MSPHIVLTTFGSLGDLHPYIAVGMKLREQGARVTIATSPVYRQNVEREGIAFHPVRPELLELVDHPEQMARALHPVTGGSYILNKLVLPYLAQSYEDLLPLAREADLLVSHALTFATPIAADVLKKPWVSVLLQPAALLSAYDPPTAAGIPLFNSLRGMGPVFWRALLGAGKVVMRYAGAPVNSFRKKVGAPLMDNPIFDGMRRGHARQGWFPKVLAPPQPDWPERMQITGYPFYDEVEFALTDELQSFVADGSPPVVFTMGSAAVFDAGTFYRESAAAAERCGVRAVLLIGNDERNRPQRALPKTIITVPYAPYAALFPHAAAIVHQGGIGTTSQALRAARPMLILPYSHDQPDNAERVARIGCARVIARRKYNATTAAAAITELLTNGAYTTAAEQAAATVAKEDGATTAASLLLTVASRPGIQ